MARERTVTLTITATIGQHTTMGEATTVRVSRAGVGVNQLGAGVVIGAGKGIGVEIGDGAVGRRPTLRAVIWAPQSTLPRP
jgi:hypothetical protein